MAQSPVGRRKVFQQPHSLSKAAYFSQASDVGSEAMWVDKWRQNVIVASDHSKNHDVAWVLSFHQYRYILWG